MGTKSIIEGLGTPARIGRRRLLTSVGGAALAIACAFPSAAWAEDYTVNSEADLIAAINSANASPDANATITMGSSFTVSTALPAATKPILFDPQGNVLTTSGTIASSGDGLLLTSAPGITGQIVNVGSIRGGDAVPGAAGGRGVSLNRLDLVNNGTISGGTSNGYTDTALNPAAGVSLDISTFVNNGTVLGGNSQGGRAGAGVFVNALTSLSTTSITNTSTGIIRGGSDLTGAGSGEVGILIHGTEAVTLDNSGLIEGGNGAAAIALDSASSNVSIINSGAIRAGAGGTVAIDLSQATRTLLELRGGSNIVGDVIANPTPAFANTLQLGGSVDDSFDVSKLGPTAQFQNFTRFTKTGTSTWTLTGDGMLPGVVDLQQGALVIGNGGTTGPQFTNIDVSGTLIFQRDSDYTAGSISGTGGSVVQSGSGTTTLASTNFLSDGSIRITGGKLSVGSDSQLDNSLSSTLTIDGGMLQWTGSGSITRTINWGTNGGGFDVTGTGLSIAQALVGGGALTKSGTGSLVLAGDNTYVGGTTIAAGTLTFGSGGTTGSVLGDIVDNGTLGFNRSDAYIYAGAITGSGKLTKSGAGTLTLTGHSSYDGDTAITGGLSIAAGGTVASGGATSMTNNSATLTIDGTGSAFGTASISAVASLGKTQTVSVTNGGHLTTTSGDISLRASTISDASTNTAQLIVDGADSLVDVAGGLVLANLNTTSGDLTISGGGALRTAGANIIGYATGNTRGVPSATIIGAGSNWTSTNSLVMSDGSFTLDQGGSASFTNATFGTATDELPATLTVSGAGSSLTTTTGDLTIGSGAGTGVLTLSNGGAVNVAGSLVLADDVGATGVLNIGGAEGEAAEAAGAFTAPALDLGSTTSRLNFNHTDTDYLFGAAISGAGAINQVAGDTNLTGASNGFTGTATVSGGTLRVNGTLGDATSTVNVLSGRLGGDGTIGGSVAITDGVLAPGNSPGTLTIDGNLTLTGTSLLDYEFGHSNVVGGPLNDLTVVGGDLTLAGTIDVTKTTGGSFDPGLYRVISYGGLLDNQGLAIGSLPPGTTAEVQIAIDHQVNLVNTTGVTVNFWDGTGTHDDSSIEGGDGVWQDDTGNDNWTAIDGSFNAPFQDASYAIFSAAPGTVTVDDTAGPVSASGIQFASDGYRIEGSALSLVGPQTVIRVGDGTTVGQGFTATIASALTGSAQVEKTDLGTLVLTGTNSYTGGTSVAAGTLLINGDETGATGATTVASGASLGGTGTIGGNVTLADGAILTPGAGAAGTLIVDGDLSLASGSKLAFEFGEAGVAGGSHNDLVEVGGNLVLDGTIDVTEAAGGTYGPGIYRIFDYDGTLTDNGLTVGTLPGGSALVQTAIAGQVNLVATDLVLNFWDGAGARDDHSITGGSGTWQNGTGNNNWTDQSGAVNAGYSDDAFAVFGGAGGAVTVDDGLGQVTASGMQFAADGYTITGDAVELTGPQTTIRVGDGSIMGAGFRAMIDAGLSGSSQLVKTDAGTLVLGGANSYTGGTAIDGGTLEIASDANLGAAAGNVTLDGGTLATSADIASSRTITLAGAGTIATADATTFTLNGPLAGTSALTKAGAGTLLLTGDDSGYTGATTVAAGTLAVTGTFGGTTAVAGGSRLEGTGQVGSVTNAGAVAPGRGIGTLTVAGSYTGSGGNLEIEAALGSDASQADRLVVGSGTSGSTTVEVINRGGLGAQTSEGIKIVDVTGGASAGTFALKGDYDFEGSPAVIAGAYGYRLVQGGTSTPGDGDWYLRSSLLDASSAPGAPSAPLYQPGVPLYESYASTLQTLNRVSTLQERVGNRQWSGVTQGGFGMWGRMDGTRYRPEAAVSSSATDLDVNDWTIQAGLDKGLLDSKQGTLIAGINVRYGKADAQVRSRFGNGDNDTDGYGVGATLTWYGSTGFYVDMQAQVNWYRTDLTSGVLGKLVDDNHGSGEAFSVEAGKRAPIGGGFSVTPQVQMDYSNVRFDPFADPAGAAVSSDGADSLRTRWGVSLDHQTTSDGTHGAKQSHIYGIVNLTYEWLDGNVTDVSGTPIARRDDRLWGELGLGGSYSWGGGRYTLYTEVAADTAISDFGDSNSLRGSAGFRMGF